MVSAITQLHINMLITFSKVIHYSVTSIARKKKIFKNMEGTWKALSFHVSKVTLFSFLSFGGGGVGGVRLGSLGPIAKGGEKRGLLLPKKNFCPPIKSKITISFRLCIFLPVNHTLPPFRT